MSRYLLLLSLLLVYDAVEANHLEDRILGFIGATSRVSEKPIGYDTFSPDLGILLNKTLIGHTTLNLQLNYTGTEKLENILTYGFIQTCSSIDDFPIEFQIGKFRYEHGLFGGNLTNPRLRPALLAPQSIYFTPLKYNITSAYGIKSNLYFKNFELSASVGQPMSQDPYTEASTWINQPVAVLKRLNSASLNAGFGSEFNVFLKHETLDNIAKVEYAQLHLSPLINIEALTVGDQINFNGWSISGELMTANNLNAPASSELWNLHDVNLGYSLTVNYEITDDIKASLNFNEYLQGSKGTKSTNNRNEFRDLNFGVSWSVTPDIVVRGEIHRINGSRIIPDQETFYRNDYNDYIVTNFGIAYFF